MSRFIRTMIPMAFLISCQTSTQPPSPASSVLAMINDEAITLSEFEKALEDAQSQAAFEMNGDALKSFKRELLDQLIDHRLFMAEAARLKISMEPQEVEEAIEQVQGDYSPEDFQRLLQSRRIGFEEWKENLKKDLLVRKLINQMMTDPIEVTEKEIEEYYQNHRKDFQQKEAVRARQIVVKTEGEARDIQKLLNSGQDFGEMAKTHSLGPERNQGGDLGFFSRGEMPEEFDVIFTLKAGQLSPVVKSPYGYHLFKLEERRPGKTLTLRETAEPIRDLLSQSKREAQFKEWATGLRQKAKIQINYPLLDAAMPRLKAMESAL
jgi:peptidyl-prolyl cis-trans isomerase C